MSSRNGLLATIHIAKKELGLEDGTYRDILEGVLGVRSLTGVKDRQKLTRVIMHLRACGWEDSRPQAARHTPPRPIEGCEALMGKIGAYLAEAKRPWSYATALSKRLCKIDALEWCKAEDLAKIVAALDYDAKRRARRAV